MKGCCRYPIRIDSKISRTEGTPRHTSDLLPIIYQGDCQSPPGMIVIAIGRTALFDDLDVDTPTKDVDKMKLIPYLEHEADRKITLREHPSNALQALF